MKLFLYILGGIVVAWVGGLSLLFLERWVHWVF